jgi:hypothetical protein
MSMNDTYGEITAAELADLRLHAQRCAKCGMLASVDPAFHTTRYGHAPEIRRPGGACFQWNPQAHAWVQTA